jgi:undecaprenyl diphosphate synthase
VWELAYSELVYIDVSWRDLAAVHLAEAIGAFQGRHRRFGGLD